MNVAVNRILETFAVLKPDLGVEPVDVTPGLYEALDTGFAGFAGHVLISAHEFTGDWPTWEKHPAGDEVVMLLSGQATLVLRTETGEVATRLDAPGTFLVVPRNTWHTARIPDHARMLFITPGEGTENRDSPPAT